MSMPPLPPVLCHTKDLDQQYTAEQMQEYGQQCRSEALEEAAQVCESENQGWHCNAAAVAATKIRSLR